MRLLWIAWLIVGLASLCRAETIRVGAAVSLREALGEIARRYEAETPDKVELSFGSSGQVAGQVRAGAEIDVFVSAAERQVADLEREGRVVPGSRRPIAGNALVLIVPADGRPIEGGFKGLAEAVRAAARAKVAIGDPRTVPAGQYAMQVLKALGLEHALEGRLVHGANARQVLDYVARGEVLAGVVYATDARERPAAVKVVAEAPADAHDPIVYPAVLIADSRKREAGERFLKYLSSDPARTILREKGFKVP